MTEPGGTGGAPGAGNRPGEAPLTSGGWDADPAAPATPGSAGEPAGGEPPRWQPFSDAPGAPGSEATPSMTPPMPVPPSPTYVPLPTGMSPAPGTPPPGPADVPSSAWITTGPQAAPPKRRNRLVNIIGGIIGILIIGGVIAGVLGLLPNDKGKILFGTAAGSDLCSVTNPATTIKTTDPIFFTAILKHHMDGQQSIVFLITKDGTQIINHPEPADGTEFDCYGNRESLGALDAGTYVFQVLHGTDIEATGTLTVQ